MQLFVSLSYMTLSEQLQEVKQQQQKNMYKVSKLVGLTNGGNGNDQIILHELLHLHKK